MTSQRHKEVTSLDDSTSLDRHPPVGVMIQILWKAIRGQNTASKHTCPVLNPSSQKER